MYKKVSGFILFLLVSSVVCGASLQSMYGKVPPETMVFVATSGTDNFQSDFQNSTMGQIAADPMVKNYFDQLMESVSKLQDLQGAFTQGKDYIEFVKGLLATPTIIGVAQDADHPDDEFYAFLLSGQIVEGTPADALFKQMLQSGLQSKMVVKREIQGQQIYVSNDPNAAVSFYVAPLSDMLLVSVDDTNYSVLESVVNGAYNTELGSNLTAVPSTNDAFVMYFDFQTALSLIKKEAKSDTDAQEFLTFLAGAGLTDMQNLIIKAGFEGKNLVIDGKIKTPTADGVWSALGPVDKGLFDYVDPKAMQANAVHVDPLQLYDSILDCVKIIAASEGTAVEPKIADFEKQIGFNLRDDLFASLEGSVMGYGLPPYSSPELLTGAFVMTARLKDAEKFKKSMLAVETLVKSMAPAEQLQINVQKDANGKEIHIWAVSMMALMQVMPSWAIEGDTLVLTSHPIVTMKMIQRIASGSGESLLSNPDFSSALSRIPTNAFTMSLSDSKVQARQIMNILQQYLPMLNMGLMQEGIQLPILLPSIESYIEQMEPGLSYVSRASDGIEFRYEGTGLEATSGGVAGGAMAAAILMPALSRTKKVAQRVVCGTNLKGLTTAMVVYCNDYEDTLPTNNWCDLLIEEADVSPKSFVCPQSDAIEGESSYAMNKNIAGKKLGQLPADVVLFFETDKGIEAGPRNTSVLTRRHHQVLDIYDEDTMVYKDRFNQLGGPEDLALHHNQNGQLGCNIAFFDGHVEFVPQDRIADLKWTAE